MFAEFRDLGLKRGDVVMVHVSSDALDPATLLGALREAVGEEGTILAPAYTFSFCRGEVFDLENTPAAGGPWSTSQAFLEYFRTQPEAVRSGDPIHSIAGIGPDARSLLSEIPPTCFGPGSVFARLRERGAKICMIGCDLGEATFRHHAEELAGVPFRFRKLFTGTIRGDGRTRRTGWLYYVRVLAANGFPDGSRVEKAAIDAGVARVGHAGGARLLSVDCREYFDLVTREIARDRWITARGPAGDVEEIEAARTRAVCPEAALPKGASMTEMISALWRLPRDIVSDGYDAALRALASQLPMRIHEYPTGTDCWGWIVPEKWTCHEAWLETLDGRRLISYADNPLHVVSYSLPFEGVVARDELFRHLHTHPQMPDAVPFVFKYYERDWGLCCSRALKDSLREERYRIVIRTSFRYSTLKVGEVVAPGTSGRSIVLCAHLCHPAMVNDDLTGVVVGMKVIEALLARKDRRYTWRLLIVPETIGSVAWLSANESLIPSMEGGLFLEMLGRGIPHTLQLSFAGDTETDRCFRLALKECDPHGSTCAYRTIPGNDERQFNGPGVRVPMLSLARILPAGAAEAPYREYHSSLDTPDRVLPQHLEESLRLVLDMADCVERNTIPLNRFRGEPFCSRYGLHIDPYEYPEGNRGLFRILDLVDGTNSIAAIALRAGVSFSAVDRVVQDLRRAGLAE